MPVERNIREILTGQAALNEADQTKRLDMLVRQGLMSQAKLPILRRGLDKLKGGKALAPNERDAVNTLMNSFMYIVLGDDTVFTRAKMHTQKNKYQSEEIGPDEEENDEYEEILADGDDFVGEEDLTEKQKNFMVDLVSQYLSEKDIKQPKAEEPTANHPAETSTEGDTSPPTQGDSDAKDREHMCVSKMFKKELGEGTCIPGEHADPDENGHVEWYTVMFESGIEKVYINEDDVEILDELVHKHKSKKYGVVEDYDTPAKKKPVSQMTSAEKKENDKRRKAYNEFQKSKRNEEVEIEEGAMSKDKAGHTTGGFRISNKEADAAKKRLTKKAVKRQVQAAAARIDEPLKMQLQRQGKLKEEESVTEEGSERAMPPEKSREETKKIKDRMRAKNKLRPKGYQEETEIEEGAFKRMATDAEEEARLKAQKKASKDSKKAADKEKETDPGIKEAYKKKFDAMLKKTGKSLKDMSDDEKKAFFNKVDASHTAKHESLISFDDFDLKEYITSKQVKMAKGIAFDKRHKGGDMTGAVKKMEKIKKGLSNHPGAKKALRQANEDTDLEEGAYSDARRDAARDSRGLASTKKDRPDVKHDAKKDSGPEHIVPQLRKAVSIGKHVTFKDGKSHRISQAHASKFLNKYLSSKPADKEKMQDHAHQSHKHFMKHV
tara:strand:+ start:381 stop:2372 length:1992 start_codon:yes stop_codon:yes gene_type:complete